MRWFKSLAGSILLSILPAAGLHAVDLGAEARDILQRRCLGCHGTKTKMAGLDLSTRSGAEKGGSKGTALKPGVPSESLLWARISKGEMPPAAPLPSSEKELLHRWIEAGAAWTGALTEMRAGLDWWALQPLSVSHAPTSSKIPAAWSKSPLDKWIYSKLKKQGLAPSPPADRRTLIRRASFDVRGLPPTPEEVEAFAKDSRPDAYERLIDTLLGSPQYGEQWARHWLDVVRYSESEGFERDWLRDHAWPYRDYVIRSLNQDKPYSLFAKEQIAGDVLEPVTRDGITATSLLVLGPYDAVGLTSAVPHERAMVRADQLEEMLGVVSQTFLGLTVNCARCHDHKFDPIPQKDYYRLKAVFEGVWQPTEGDELKADGRALLTPDEHRDWNEKVSRARARVSQLEGMLGDLHRAARRSIEKTRGFAAATLPPPIARWTFDADTRDDFGSLHAGANAGQIAEGRLQPASDKDTVMLSTDSLKSDLREKTLEAWIHIAKPPEKYMTVMRIRNRSGFRGAAYDGIQYVAEKKKKRWESVSTVRFRSEEVNGPAEDTQPGEKVHIAIVYADDDTIQLYRNGQFYGKAYRPDVSLAAGRLQTYFKNDAIVELTSSKEMQIEEARMYAAALTPEQVAASYQSGVLGIGERELVLAMTKEDQARRSELLVELTKANDDLKAIPSPAKAFAAAIRKPEPTHLLIRGDVTQKGEQVAPGAPSCIPGLAPDLGLSTSATDGERRRALAGWIASEANPLFSRVMANRIWHYHFGTGLMENPNDFGFNGGKPSHPELLDWLANEFVRGGWSMKKLHRLILTSQTYRQSAQYNARAAQKDAENRLLWRYSPHRLSGEAVRDAVLAVSGKLNRTMFGSSFRPFKIVKNSGSYHSYEPVDSDDAEQQRRTIYRMNVNSGGNPMLEALDCPVPSVKTPRRTSTTTPLQALSLMNNAFIQRQAKAFAQRLSEERPDTKSRVQRGFVLATGGPPDADQLAWSTQLVKEHGLELFCWGLFNSSQFVYVQ
jgi:mono/diheme cytochrome c family protein